MEAARLWARGELLLTDDQPEDKEDSAHQHTVDALAIFGLVLEEPLPAARQAPCEFFLWPEHARPFTLFLNMVTQWRVGFGGPVGLEHAALRAVVERHAPAGHRRGAVAARHLLESQLCALERGALQGWGERSRERESKPPS